MKGNVQGIAYKVPLSSELSLVRLKKESRNSAEKKTESGRNKETTVVSPKCARCKNHGMICPLKGHKGLCKWKSCTCPNCSLIVERQKIMAAEQSVLKEMAELRKSGTKATTDSRVISSVTSTSGHENIARLKEDMTGVREYICLHFGSEEARTTMAELDDWSQDKDPQPCYINILRRLFPDIKPKVLQLLLAACDGDFIKTVETILPCCKKMKNDGGQVTYIKASTPPQRMMMLSKTHKFPTRIHDKRELFRYSPYHPLNRTHARCPPFPGMFVPPYAHAPVTPNDNCGLYVPSYLPPYYFSRPANSREHISLSGGYPYYTTPKFDLADCKTVSSDAKTERDDNKSSAAATLIALSNSN